MAVDGHVLEGDDFFCLVHSWEGRVVGLGCHSGVLLVLQKLSELVPVYPSGGVPGEHEAEYGPELGPVALLKLVQTGLQLLPADLCAVLVIAVVLALQQPSLEDQHAGSKHVFPVWVGHRFGDVLDVDHLALFRREVDVSQAALVVD